MGYCGGCLRVTGYSLIPLLAVLAYFHTQCRQESQEKVEQTRFTGFNPDITDIENYALGFAKIGSTLETFVGLEYMLDQFCPCAVIKLINYISGHKSVYDKDAFKDNLEMYNVTFHDARKKSPGNFHETGFTLIALESEPNITDWRSHPDFHEGAEITQFHAQMEPYIRELYPDVKRMVWTYNVVRGGGLPGDQPKAVDGIHLDYHQGLEARKEFHKEFPIIDPAWAPSSEPNILMGGLDTEDSKFGVLLGVWKPLTDAVCDNPLALMDARTFDPEHQTFNKLHLNFLFLTFHSLTGGIAYSPRQQWYYYPFQSQQEVLVFHQYSSGRFHANPHGSFNNKNCPEGSVSRVSVELRLALFF